MQMPTSRLGMGKQQSSAMSVTAKQQHTSAGTLPFLPTPAVINILRYVPQKQRLDSCACVCQQWAAAAIAATTDIKLTAQKKATDNLQTWLKAQGNEVSSIDMAIDHDKHMCLLLRLPGSQLTSLTSLVLQGFNVDIGPSPSGGTDGAVCALPKLQKLQLSKCSSNRKHFLRFSQLTALTSLELSSVVVTGNTGNHLQLEETPLPGEERAAAFGYVLGAMRKLAHMSILVPQQQTGLRAAAFQQAGVDSMQDPQRIELSGIHFSKGMVLPLPTSLTRLQLGVVTGQGLVPETVPDLALGRLTNLVHLEISKVAIDGAVLAGVPQLQQLTLREGQENPRTALTYVVSGQTRLAKSVLRALCQLTQLQRLDLSDVPLHRVTDLPSQAELLPALAASTGLQSLQLQHDAAAPLPVGALQHMLKRRQLPQLRVLSLCNRYQLRVPYSAVPVYDR